MKSLAVVAAAGALLVGGTVSTLASSHSSAATGPAARSLVLTMRIPSLHGLHGLRLQRVEQPLQTGSTDTPTPTPTGTVAPAPTATATPPVNGGPDPQTLLSRVGAALGLVKSVHFEFIFDGDVTPQTLHIDAPGDFTCSGPSLKAHVTAKLSVDGTQQSSSKQFNLIEVKNSRYWKSSSTKKTWQAAKAAQLTKFVFGFPVLDGIEGQLPCGSSGGSGSGSGSSGGSPSSQPVFSHLINVGSEVYLGQKVWHLQETETIVDPSTNQQMDSLVDIFVDQQHPLLYGYVVSYTAPDGSDTEKYTTNYSKYGEKLKISKPTKGSTKP